MKKKISLWLLVAMAMLFTGAAVSMADSPPVAPTLNTPAETIAQDIPEFNWNSLPDASHYLLRIKHSNGANFFTKWYRADLVDKGDGTCSIDPVALSPGDYYWMVRARHQLGYTHWSARMAFTVVESISPAAPTLNSPSGTIDQDNPPEFNWNSVPNADYYALCIKNSSGTNIFTDWYPADVVDNGNGTCSVDPKALNPGNYYWLVQARNQYGYGSWSTQMTFTVEFLAPPDVPTLNTPQGTINQAIPEFNWDSVPDAAYYGLRIKNSSGTNIFTDWYRADLVDNGDGTCSIDPVALGPGGYSWMVQARNRYGDGTWSARMTFTVVPILAPIANTTILWPPNHKMVDIIIETNVLDNSGGPVTLSAEVMSNEPIEGLGDGDISPDWTEPEITPDGLILLRLRAERSGSGEGRVYTVVIYATDESGNTSSAGIDFIVPHNQPGNND